MIFQSFANFQLIALCHSRFECLKHCLIFSENCTYSYSTSRQLKLLGYFRYMRTFFFRCSSDWRHVVLLDKLWQYEIRQAYFKEFISRTAKLIKLNFTEMSYLGFGVCEFYAGLIQYKYSYLYCPMTRPLNAYRTTNIKHVPNIVHNNDIQ